MTAKLNGFIVFLNFLAILENKKKKRNNHEDFRKKSKPNL